MHGGWNDAQSIFFGSYFLSSLLLCLLASVFHAGLAGS
jgi:hypothetical protein